ncbi:DegT/DnrJ/EryC1/StrS family aminotransferase [Szabonella alba]|uniref:DegT/DnrJ/EryC1/StrS family aminotransferase n=1 Tax=Szabonella alba TaxID=2804194 RepID=A0A8K0VBS0_9RHOB|nr:DegT/DnrJ/EryC1/StrS family aminotransferase [Szabonella alba]MBL4919177.1 DegT/DnrJ/EryC1/StrS family aminotransferase [Szabonella alba]
MIVPMYDHAALYRKQKAEFDAAIANLLESGNFDWGNELPAFEQEFADWLGVRYATGTSSGSAALRAALRALDIGPGDEVITVANTDLAGSSAIRMVGATVCWVDIEPVSRCIDPGLVEAAITPATRAILPVDIYGHPADMPALKQIARRHGLSVLQDSCLALGAEIDGKMVGSFADITCFSFSPGKHLGSFGSGGACSTDSPELADRVRMYSSDGQDRSHHYRVPRPLDLQHETDGENARLQEIQATVLRVKLGRLSEFLDIRRHQARLYRELLSDLPITLPEEKPGFRHAWRNYTIETDDRLDLSSHLLDRGIASNALYSPPMHLQKVHASLGYRRGALPVTELSCARILSLPIGPHLSAGQVEEVAEAVKNHYH